MIVNSIGYVNSLSNIQGQKRTLKSVDNVLKTNNIDQVSFGATVMYGFRKVRLENAESKMVYDRISQMLKKIPDSARMVKPMLIATDKEKYGFTWDKTTANRYKLIIKNNIETKEDWDKVDPMRSVMSCMFDEHGMMIVGELTKPINSNYNQGLFFHHSGRNGRRMRLDGLVLRPVAIKDNLWSVIQELSSPNSTDEIDLGEKLKDTMLSDMFLEFSKNKTSILI